MRKRRKWLIVVPGVLAVLAAAFLIYTSRYYHADDTARAALISDNAVTVIRTDYGWLFDGPSEETALVFYPGAKVEAEAYAPMLHLLAEKGMDVCLVEMPFRLALFGMNSAWDVIQKHSYSRWFTGGHSLGGAMAANYAASHGARVSGVILFAAYPTKQLDDMLTEISIYGTEDGILNLGKMVSRRNYAPKAFYECMIEGGNHAQFGNYGEQQRDGKALISAEEQQAQAVEFIIQHIQAEPAPEIAGDTLIPENEIPDED